MSEGSWRSDLELWLAPFLSRLGHPARRAMCPAYVAGLIGPGERKSVAPLAERQGMVSHDALHHFIAVGPWDEAALEEELARQADRLVGGPEAYLIVDVEPTRRTRGRGKAQPRWALRRNMRRSSARTLTARPLCR